MGIGIDDDRAAHVKLHVEQVSGGSWRSGRQLISTALPLSGQSAGRDKQRPSSGGDHRRSRHRWVRREPAARAKR
jgi:hypothetical protein